VISALPFLMVPLLSALALTLAGRYALRANADA
jgi:hypothetical protein